MRRDAKKRRDIGRGCSPGEQATLAWRATNGAMASARPLAIASSTRGQRNAPAPREAFRRFFAELVGVCADYAQEAFNSVYNNFDSNNLDCERRCEEWVSKWLEARHFGDARMIPRIHEYEGKQVKHRCGETGPHLKASQATAPVNSPPLPSRST